MSEPSQRKQFTNLCRRVKACRSCERMAGSARVLGAGSGKLSARLMFIGEAPGRHGADQTMIPFHGDVSGRNFEEFLAAAGLSREQLFITNAALCNPKDDRGNNATPTRAELQNCSRHLRSQIELLNPVLVVTLGAVALRGLEMLEPHGLQLRDGVRTMQPWFGRQLIPLYHPGARALIHRARKLQRADYRFVATRHRRLLEETCLA